MKKRSYIMLLSIILLCFVGIGNVKAGTLTEDDYYALLAKYTYSQPYDALKVLVQANADYPNNQYFVDQIGERVNTILSWSIGSHTNSNFNGAIYGYDTIINTPTIKDYIKNYVKRQKARASESKLPTTADEYDAIASQYTYSQPYDAINIYSEALVQYSNDKRFSTGVKNRALTILSWSDGSHKNKNFNGAIYGYNTVINAPSIPENVKNYAVRQKKQAVDSKLPFTADEYDALVNQLFTRYQPYDALKLYDEAMVGYPNDTKIINGINDRAETIFQWSKGSQNNGNFAGAIYGYETIINQQGVKQSLKDSVVLYLDYAKQNKKYISADEYYSQISQYGYSQPYDALKVLIEANSVYPNDSRFLDGIKNRINTILNWSQGSHVNKNYNGAIYGYQVIVNTPIVDKYVKNYAGRQLDKAKNSQPITTVQEYTSLASQFGYSSPYAAMDIYMEAAIGYPDDSTIRSGANNRAKVILSWSNGSHMNKSYDSAIYGYDTVINAPVVKYMKDYAARQKEKAANGQMPVDEAGYADLINQVITIRPFEALAISSEAVALYDTNQTILDLLNKSASGVMTVSIASHKAGNYQAAESGYYQIINAPLVSADIVSRAKTLLDAALKHVFNSIAGKVIVLDAGHNYGGDDGAYGNGLCERTLNMQVVQILQQYLEAQGANVILTRKPEDINYDSSDESLKNRVKIANDAKADLFISIHHDSSESSSVSGTSAFYSSYRNHLDTSDVYVSVLDSGGVIREYNSSGRILTSAIVGQRFGYIREESGGFIINYNGKEAWISNAYCRAYDPTPSDAAILSAKLAEAISSDISSLGLYNRGVTDRNLYVTRMTEMPSVLVEVGFISNASEASKISQSSFQQSVAQKIKDAIVKLFSF